MIYALKGQIYVDIATVAGILLALGSLAGGFMMDGGSIGALFSPTAMVIIFGGTIGTVLTGLSLKEFLSLGKYIRVSLFDKPQDPMKNIDKLCELATRARREGLLALEDELENIEDPFIRANLQLVIDGTDEELLRELMEIEVSNIEVRHKRQAGIFDTAGGFAPTMGIIGTVMGLVHVLGSLSDVTTLGPKIATAFIATLYGVGSANVLWHPIANKLKARNLTESLLYEIATEGILSIQAGESPKAMKHKLVSFLSRTEREKSDDQNDKAGRKEGSASAETREA